MAHLSLVLFGRFQASLDGLSVTGFDTRKTRALLAFLAEEQGKVHSRLALADLLWPERSECQALNNLRNNLAVLRRAINDETAHPSYLLIDRETVSFNPASCQTVDTVEFSRLIPVDPPQRPLSHQEIHKLQSAVELYSGDFLDSFSSPACPNLEAWILTRRTNYRFRMGEALAALTRTCLDCGQNHQAARYARQLLELDPWNEDACLQLMESLVRDGKRNEALEEFKLYRSALKSELDVEPTPETLRVVESIRAGNAVFPARK